VSGPIGREPIDPNNKDFWFPNKNQQNREEEPKLKPSYVEGHHLGSRGMATVEDMIRQINEANVKAGEAIGALGQVKDEMYTVVAQLIETKNRYGNALGEVIQARDLVAMTMEQIGSSATLGDMLGILQKAIDDDLTPSAPKFDEMQGECGVVGQACDEASTNCASAMEKGEQFIGNLMA